MEERLSLATALARVQAEMQPAEKNGYNPHFKSNFSTLEDLVAVSRPLLTKYGISITQYPESEGDATYLVTKIMHDMASIVSKVRIHLKDPTDMQKFGSAMSYIKRNVYAAICGISTSEGDDDGNEISQPSVPSTDAISPKQLGLLKAKIGNRPEVEKKILARCNITSLDQLPWRIMNDVIRWLESLEGQHE